MDVSTTPQTIPLFPLNAVLFPGGVLPLRIFEPRYLEMISQCLKTECGIGVILIQEGVEVGLAARTHEVGTLSHISYWHKRKDGLLGVTLSGEKRFRILSAEVQPNQLIYAKVEFLDPAGRQDLPENQQPLAMLLQQIISQLEPPYTTMKTYYDDLEWVSARLVELLPMDLADKQLLLQINDIDERVLLLKKMLARSDML